LSENVLLPSIPDRREFTPPKTTPYTVNSYDDKTLFVHLLVISIFVTLYTLLLQSRIGIKPVPGLHYTDSSHILDTDPIITSEGEHKK
jgi:hypothetical protein